MSILEIYRVHVALGIQGYLYKIHGFVRHGFVLSQETLWKMASAGCYGWKIRAAVRIPAVPVAPQEWLSILHGRGTAFSMVSIF